MRTKFWKLIKDQLTQGTAPHKLALTVAMAAAIGVFPIWGLAAPLCVLAGCTLKLNHPLMQIVNAMMHFAYFPLLPIFIRVGEAASGAKPISFSISQIFQQMARGPLAFIDRYGVTGLHSVLGWFLAAPFLVGALYLILLPAIKKIYPRVH